jgi:hypothetical protein
MFNMGHKSRIISLLEIFKPRVHKKNLLMIAGLVWALGGTMLISRGIIGIFHERMEPYLELIIGICSGSIFYFILFSRISAKHLNRITGILHHKPCIFSFFSFRSYIMMTVMIGGGITLRKLDIINHQVLFTFYIVMGIPLLVSALNFFTGWWKYGKPS